MTIILLSVQLSPFMITAQMLLYLFLTSVAAGSLELIPAYQRVRSWNEVTLYLSHNSV